MAREIENDDLFMKLPEGFREKFMQQVVSRTSPADAIRLSSVSKLFQSVADSNVVWDSFIPPDHVAAVDPVIFQLFEIKSTKNLFLLLTGIPVYFHQGDDDDSWKSVSYFLDQWSGKRWFRICSNKLSITYRDTDYWISGIRLGHVAWLEIKRKVSTCKLSANTTYAAYLLFSLPEYFYYGFHVPVETSVGITEEESIIKSVYLDPDIAKSKCQYLKRRKDNLFEVELGDYFNNAGENRDLEVTVREVKSGKPKCGMSIWGIELRPKRDSINLYCNSFHKTHSHAKRDGERREGEMSKEREEGCEDTDLFSKLPEGLAQAFMEEIVSRTSPVDACRLLAVSKRFRSAAESDVVWERFLPSDYQQFFSRADSHLDISFATKKELYLFLIGNPLLLDGNTKSFWLDKWSGKKCFMITISFAQHPVAAEYMYSDWWGPNSDHSSRFINTFTSRGLTWFEIRGKISTSLLSPDTTYTAYLVHKSEFLDRDPVENPIPFKASVGSSGDESVNRVVYLDRKTGETGRQYAVERKDGWLEVELGEYYNKGGENEDLEMSVMEVTSGIHKDGYAIQGIEIRPKHG
ncbi:uncharacterized protein LOC141693050 [Apium graveolens]|uniref:uncharacterized protein LOC141693050 n=1 Tax=Apium graveolens TaxID=4045 RepID=UPI003D793060